MVVIGSLLSVIVLLRLVYVWTASIDNMVFRITDDAYYYFNTARNIVLGFGVSFDRMNPTNGFHPLWMLCLLPVFMVWPDSLEVPIRVVSSGLAVMAGITAWLMFRAIREWFGPSVAILMVPVIGLPFIANHMLNGMETGLLLFLLLVAIRLDQRWGVLAAEATVKRAALFGLLLGLVFLSRLDSVFVIGSMFAMWSIEYQRRPTPIGLRGLAAAVIGCGFVGAIFVLWNVVSFGHMMPISGAIKSSFPVLAVSVRTFRSPAVLFHAVIVVAALCVLAWPGRKLFGRAGMLTTGRRGIPPMLVALWVGAAVHLSYEVGFTKWGLEWWHFASHIPGLLFLVALAAGSVTGRWSATWRGVCVGCIAVVIIAFGITEMRLRGDHHGPWLTAARWARAHTPETSVFAMTDSGLFGYFSARRTVNLDGVINSYAFQRALSQGRLGEFLAGSGVTYLADYEVPVPIPAIYRIRLLSGLFGGPVSELQATPGAEIYRSESYEDHVSKLYGRGPIAFVIWDFSGIRIVVG